MEIAVKLVMFGCIFSLAMASWIPGRPPPKIEDYSNEVNEKGAVHDVTHLGGAGNLPKGDVTP